MPTLRAEPTPNPNSLKFTADAGPFVSDGMVSITSEDEADQHPLGTRLFALAGVTNVFITPDFVTVSKDDSAEWPDLKPDVESILADYLAD